MQRTCYDFLAAARFAGQQHRHIRLAEASDRAEHVLHRWRLPEDLRNVAGYLVGARLAHAFVDRTPDQLDRLVDVERLRQVLERAALER